MGPGRRIGERQLATEVELTPVALSDVDLFSEWERDLGWDIQSTQLSAGTNEIRFDHFALPGLLVGRFRSKQSMESVFAVPDGLVVFTIPRARLPLVWSGRHFPPTLMGVIRAGRENWAVLPAGWDCYEFMVSEDLIRRTELFPPCFFAETTRLERAYLPLVEPITGRFLEQLDSFFHVDEGVAKLPGTVVPRARFFERLIEGLHQVFDAGLSARDSHRPRSVRRPDLVVKTREFVSAHLKTDLSAENAADALGVSYRVLNYAIRDSLGMSPYRYILTQRLHAVRRQLRSSEVSVAEACLSHGFSTPSRFARQYVRLFGVLPSETRYPGGRRSN